MADFTSALFLGHRHPSRALPAWSSLTTGRPAAMGETTAAGRLADAVAAGRGAEAGVLHRSTLHALLDLVDLLIRPTWVVAVDEGAYPLGRWAAAVARSVPVLAYPHHDPNALAAALDAVGGRPLVLTDGWCAGCGRPAPLAELGATARERGGRLVVDDTMAAGLLGRDAHGADRPYGRGGGGTFAWLGLRPGPAVVVASLAKAYGAPVTVTSGPAGLVRCLRGHGSRWHSSPSSSVEIAAALIAHADEAGNRARRRRLAGLVARLHTGLDAIGLPVDDGPSPLVTVAGPPGLPEAAHRALAAAGMSTLLRRPGCRGRTVLSLAVTATHEPRDVDRALTVLGRLAESGQAALPRVRGLAS